MGWIVLGNGIPFRRGGGKQGQTYWTHLISTVVEAASPTHVDITFDKAYPLTASHFTVWGNTVASASWTGAVITLVLGRAVVYGEDVIITYVPTGDITTATNNVAAEAEVTSYETRSTKTLDPAYKVAVNTLVTDLKTGLDSAALSEDFDFIHILGGEFPEDSVLNLVKDAHNATLEGTAPVHTPLNGLKGNGTDAYVNLHYKPKSQGVRFTLNSASLGIVSRYNAAGSTVSIGARTTGNANRTFMMLCQENKISYYLNTNQTTLPAITNLNSEGIYITSRTANNLTNIYKDAVSLHNTDHASSDLTDEDLIVFGLNDAGTPGLFDTRRFMVVFGGRGFSSDESGIVNNAFKKFSETVGSAYCWFTRRHGIYDDTVKKSFIGLLRNNCYGHSQYIDTINHTTGDITHTKIGSIYQYEDHNEPSILLRSSDNRLLTFYTEHALSDKLRWKLSTNPLDATAWGAENTFTASGNVAYTQSYQATSGNIYVIYRESNNGWCYVKSTDGGGTFGGRTLISIGVNREAGSNPGYIVTYQSPIDKNIIHFLMATAHPWFNNEVVISAFYFDCTDDKFYKLDGTETTANLPFDAYTDMTTIMSNTMPDTGWIDDIVVDASGNPRYLFTIMPNGKNTNYLPKEQYYCEWTGSALSTPYKLHDAMTTKWVHDSGQPNPNDTYSSLACFNVNNPDEIIASKEVDGVCEIFKLTRVAANNFTSVAITTGSTYDQWRPFTINGKYKNVCWLNKIKYGEYTAATGQTLVIKTI